MDGGRVAKVSAGQKLPDGGRRMSKLAPDSVGKMAVTREAQVESDAAEVRRRVAEHLQSPAKADFGAKPVKRHPGPLVEDAAEMEFRRAE